MQIAEIFEQVLTTKLNEAIAAATASLQAQVAALTAEVEKLDRQLEAKIQDFEQQLDDREQVDVEAEVERQLDRFDFGSAIDDALGGMDLAEQLNWESISGDDEFIDAVASAIRAKML